MTGQGEQPLVSRDFRVERAVFTPVQTHTLGIRIQISAEAAARVVPGKLARGLELVLKVHSRLGHSLLHPIVALLSLGPHCPTRVTCPTERFPNLNMHP